jgi:hypothetical protein
MPWAEGGVSMTKEQEIIKEYIAEYKVVFGVEFPERRRRQWLDWDWESHREAISESLVDQTEGTWFEYIRNLAADGILEK